MQFALDLRVSITSIIGVLMIISLPIHPRNPVKVRDCNRCCFVVDNANLLLMYTILKVSKGRVTMKALHFTTLVHSIYYAGNLIQEDFLDVRIYCTYNVSILHRYHTGR